MEQLNFFHLFTFVPVLAIGGIFCFERMYRHGAHRRTFFLFTALLIFAFAGIAQTVPWVFRAYQPLFWPQVYVLSGLFYFLAFFFLEFSINFSRINESFLLDDLFFSIRKTLIFPLIMLILGIVILIGYLTLFMDHTQAPLNFMLDDKEQANPLLGYNQHMYGLTIGFTVFWVISNFLLAFKIFNLQKGVIRKRVYPFILQSIVALVVLFHQFVLPIPLSFVQADSSFLPIFWFMFLNLVFVIRLVEEFFFWSQYNLRSDRTKLEQRQHTQTLLIRRVITSPEIEDRMIIRETMENALDKMKSRMIVQEYNLTGMFVLRAVDNILRVDDIRHLLGYCTPLIDNKSIKSLDKKKLTDLLLRTTYDLKELREKAFDNFKDYGKRSIKTVMSNRQLEVLSEIPDSVKGLQRLIALQPIFDASSFMGVLVVFKDSFDKLYPSERECLGELAENLGTIFALMNAKEVQRERNRLQNEMNTARNIQTSILPKQAAVPGYKVGTFMQTATEVGGDVYDFVHSPFGNYFGIGDVSGHGLPAGMMAVIAVSAFQGALEASKILNKEIPIDQLYDGVNRVLCTINRDRIGSDKFMTQNYFVEKNGHISHAGTHLPALVYRKTTGKLEVLHNLAEKTGFLGISEYVVSSQSKGDFFMESGDILVLYSDGVTEAKNSSGALFGLEGLSRAVLEVKDMSPQKMIDSILETLHSYAEGGDLKKHAGHFTDDVTLVVLQKD